MCADVRLDIPMARRNNRYRYLGYITKGLVKASIADIYWKIVGLRLDVNKARLGLEIH